MTKPKPISGVKTTMPSNACNLHRHNDQGKNFKMCLPTAMVVPPKLFAKSNGDHNVLEAINARVIFKKQQGIVICKQFGDCEF